MVQILYILLGTSLTVSFSIALGMVLLDRLQLRLSRIERLLAAFPTGAACLHLLVFALAVAGQARKGVFVLLGVAAIGAAWKWRRATEAPPAPALSRPWLATLVSLMTLFGFVYLVHALAPEHSPDGATYHLGLVARYLRQHGFQRIATNMYASLSQGVEMLYLAAFSVGRHSAAALTHLAFLAWLPLAMLAWARRQGFPAAGAAAGLFVFLSPVVGRDATTAYNDVAVAAILFAVFWFAELWRESGDDGWLIPLGLVAGFAYAAKYTAFLAVPYALVCVARRRFKPVLIVGLCAAAMMAPWMIKNALWLGNPVSPFFNAWFPNPSVHISFEQQYREYMRGFGDIRDWRAIPLEVTMRGGALGGLLGPLFLLAPLSLLALRYPAGRRVLVPAALFGVTYFANIGTRFLIPCLPFLALALALAFRNARGALAAMTLFHALVCWPGFVSWYSDPGAWRLGELPLAAALRREPEEAFLSRMLPSYPITRFLETSVPAGKTVLAFSAVAEAYTTRDVPVTFQSAWGEKLADIFRTPLVGDYQPRQSLRFRFTESPLSAVRVVQTARGAPDLWSVAELRLYRGAVELPRDGRWRLRARPNPWDVQLAFDNSPLTRWRSWQPIAPGMYIEIDFGRPEPLGEVRLDCSTDQYKVAMRLEGRDPDGRLRTLGEQPETAARPPIAGLRHAAMAEFKARGVEYLVVFPGDFGYHDLVARADEWGIRLLGERAGARLYRIE